MIAVGGSHGRSENSFGVLSTRRRTGSSPREGLLDRSEPGGAPTQTNAVLDAGGDGASRRASADLGASRCETGPERMANGFLGARRVCARILRGGTPCGSWAWGDLRPT